MAEQRQTHGAPAPVAPRPEGPPAGVPRTGAPPEPNGAGAAHGAVPPKAARGRTRWARLLALAVLAVIALGAGGIVGYRWWYDSVHYVSTDNAMIAGYLVQVGGLEAGRVASVQYDVGAHVEQNEVVATLQVPVPVGTTSSGTPRLEFTNTQDSEVEVKSPISGVVVARNANPGDTVPAGQSLLTVVDPQQLWVNANIEETYIRLVRPGQPVTIHVDALNADLPGHVVAVRQASAATFSLLPTQNVSGNFTKQTQLVPVKIAFDHPDPHLTLGTSVEVKIRVVD